VSIRVNPWLKLSFSASLLANEQEVLRGNFVD
jgi:hypothetical protein